MANPNTSGLEDTHQILAEVLIEDVRAKVLALLGVEVDELPEEYEEHGFRDPSGKRIIYGAHKIGDLVICHLGEKTFLPPPPGCSVSFTSERHFELVGDHSIIPASSSQGMALQGRTVMQEENKGYFMGAGSAEEEKGMLDQLALLVQALGSRL